MQAEISPLQQQIIRNSMLSKSSKEIADLLGCSAEDVNAFVAADIKGKTIITKQMMIDARQKAKKPVIKKAKEPKPVNLKKAKVNIQNEFNEAKEQKIKNLNEKMQHERNAALSKRKYKTREVDYSQRLTVKINSKTFIYAEPGETADQARARFNKNYGRTAIEE